ncbi:MAG: hypothetical protein MJZ05_13120, partial [Fibrobacter sp.]|nr:hypothetical protein [Fibrobacter sp.]
IFDSREIGRLFLSDSVFRIIRHCLFPFFCGSPITKAMPQVHEKEQVMPPGMARVKQCPSFEFDRSRNYGLRTSNSVIKVRL